MENVARGVCSVRVRSGERRQGAQCHWGCQLVPLSCCSSSSPACLRCAAACCLCSRQPPSRPYFTASFAAMLGPSQLWAVLLHPTCCTTHLCLSPAHLAALSTYVIPFLHSPLPILFVTISMYDVLLGFIFSGINSSGISRTSFRPQSALTALWLFLSSHPISPRRWHCCSSPRHCSRMVLSDLPLDIFLLVLCDSLPIWPQASTGRARVLAFLS